MEMGGGRALWKDLDANPFHSNDMKTKLKFSFIQVDQHHLKFVPTYKITWWVIHMANHNAYLDIHVMSICE